MPKKKKDKKYNCIQKKKTSKKRNMARNARGEERVVFSGHNLEGGEGVLE